MSIVQTDRPLGGWRWRFVWKPWSSFLLFLARHMLPYDFVDWVFLKTRPLTVWCACHSPNAELAARAQREVDGRG